ncbi:MAG: hypothetical protein JXA54_15980 [Candidatus Heimdallarchaeota archaeon]|nr:hypothetical protein [Candidatus Heimdallarchaeota archaeon]
MNVLAVLSTIATLGSTAVVAGLATAGFVCSVVSFAAGFSSFISSFSEMTDEPKKYGDDNNGKTHAEWRYNYDGIENQSSSQRLESTFYKDNTNSNFTIENEIKIDKSIYKFGLTISLINNGGFWRIIIPNTIERIL